MMRDYFIPTYLNSRCLAHDGVIEPEAIGGIVVQVDTTRHFDECFMVSRDADGRLLDVVRVENLKASE